MLNELKTPMTLPNPQVTPKAERRQPPRWRWFGRPIQS